ncbi:ATP-dependent nuclease [Xanthomonas arboricola]|uniref:ATP-dependent nuclease n=1 Tax=Xanthomonas arboricola TaxID=56448 RepID=UPI0016116C24|nr:AAA family ATPase [Xanthomonas arboricola]MBB4726523.1 energy-coupling factor transporter ATP-binding protein EcfA2 [Xanthomonas arboricola]
MEKRSKLLSIEVKNIGCIGNDGATVELDDIVCLVGRNNAGKSTILNSYELAKAKRTFKSTDRHQHATDDQPSEVVLSVHIPEGIGNVPAKWKSEINGYLVVKSRWRWSPPEYKMQRQTWNPALDSPNGDWDPDEKAAGLDTVFGSRLPEPIRINSLDDAATEQDQLLNLALGPLAKELERSAKDPESKLAQAVSSIQKTVTAAAQEHMEHFQGIAGKVTTGFKGVFPQLGVNLDLNPSSPPLKFIEMLKSGSQLSVLDGTTRTSAAQQGTGARRALFWAILQVRNEMERDTATRNEYQKNLEKDLTALLKPKAKSAKGEPVINAQEKIDEIKALLAAHSEGAPIPKDEGDVAFPGYLLLIDEPENALHPMAARAAQRYLYELALSPDWQVMLTTHSPYFVNPFEDHTTIVRFDRSPDAAGCLVTKTYKSDSVAFVGDEKQRLQALQQMDPSFSEVFFGSYPVIVEGDTEHAAFIAAATEVNDVIAHQLTPIRARGKALIAPLIKVLTHFKISFGVLHDTDSPFTKKGNKNGMWSENSKIWEAVQKSIAAGVTVRHRVSIPDFERRLSREEGDRDKPLNTYLAVKGSEDLRKKIRELMIELQSSEQISAYPTALNEASFMQILRGEVDNWARNNGEQDELKYKGVLPKTPPTPAPLI